MNGLDGRGPSAPVAGPGAGEEADASRRPLRFRPVREVAEVAPRARVERAFRKPVVLSVATVDGLFPARQALAFSEAGFEVDAVCRRKDALGRVSHVRERHPYDPADPVTSLRLAVEASEPDLVAPGDERAVRHLHALHAVGAAERGPAGQRLCALIARSLGDPEHFADLASRRRTLAIAEDEGVRRPDCAPLRDDADLQRAIERFGLPAVLDADLSWRRPEQVVVRSPGEARRALRRLSSRRDAAGRSERLIPETGFCVAPRDWGRRRSQVVLQRFVAGRPAAAAVACWGGEVLTELCVEAVRTDGWDGPVTVVRTLENREMSAAARRLARRFGLSGLCGFDFLLDEAEAAWLVGISRGATAICHLTASDGVEPAAALRARLTDRPRPRRAPASSGELIALFPQEMTRDPQSALLDIARHDVPARSPALVRHGLRAVGRAGWRRWLRRLSGEG